MFCLEAVPVFVCHAEVGAGVGGGNTGHAFGACMQKSGPENGHRPSLWIVGLKLHFPHACGMRLEPLHSGMKGKGVPRGLQGLGGLGCRRSERITWDVEGGNPFHMW